MFRYTVPQLPISDNSQQLLDHVLIRISKKSFLFVTNKFADPCL